MGCGQGKCEEGGVAGRLIAQVSGHLPDFQLSSCAWEAAGGLSTKRQEAIGRRCIYSIH